MKGFPRSHHICVPLVMICGVATTLIQCIVELLEPTYDDLSAPGLLCKCLHGKTQNNNEYLDKLIWDRCSKEVFVGKLTLEEAVYSAVAQFNDGNVAVLRVLELCGLSPGYLTLNSALASDVKRLYGTEQKSSLTIVIVCVVDCNISHISENI